MLERYTLPPMRELWSEEEKFALWRKVELAFLKAREEKHDLSSEAYAAIKTYACVDIVRIAELESVYGHDMEAFVVSAQESLEKAGFGHYKHEFHKGLTSYDVEDPALVLLLHYAVHLIRNELKRLANDLCKQAKAHQWTLMSARTHGQDAKPSTFGHLLAVFVDEVERSIGRLDDCLGRELAEAKISGAVGNYAGLDPQWEKAALGNLGLLPANAETQILQRDRHAMVLSALAVAAGTLEKIAATFWQMAHARVEEIREPRGSHQRGSSAMPHKRNPVKLEQIGGLARMVRAYAHAAMENIATREWHDISHSSVERHILSGATSIVHYMAVKMIDIVSNLEVFPEQMRRNFEDSFDVWASQAVLIALLDASIPYDAAYDYVQRVAFFAEDHGLHFSDALAHFPLSETDSRTAFAILGKERFNQCFDALASITPGIEHVFSQGFLELSE